jgi:pSer/pThr/pTyr-binding forkhead associated (FHA) protein
VFDRIQELDAVETISGREEQCAVFLPDLLVSRRHAAIIQTDSTFVVRDLKSRNGTHLDGRRIHCAEILREGMELQIGPYQLTVCLSIGGAIRETGSTDASTCSDLISDHNVDQPRTRLTPAQVRVYKLLLEGLIEKEVAARLGITTNTVHDHAKAIYKALAVSTRGELISRWAVQQGRSFLSDSN